MQQSGDLTFFSRSKLWGSGPMVFLAQGKKQKEIKGLVKYWRQIMYFYVNKMV
jgi:hypothetical protein